MFRNTFQKGFLSVFYSIGSKPLLIWESRVAHGNIKRLTDEDARSLALDIRGVNVMTCYITAPAAPCKSLGIKLPFLTIIVKNLEKPFSFEIQILDDRNQLRRFRCSNYQSATRVNNFTTYMPLALNAGWNQIQLNLADFTRRAYGTNYMEAVRITVNANCRLRNIYFSDRLYSDEEKPASFKFIAKEDRHRSMRIPMMTRPVEVAKFGESPVDVTNRGGGDEGGESTIDMIPTENIRPTSPISHAPTEATDAFQIVNEEEAGEEEEEELLWLEQ
jgi:hypothetical protein